MGGSYVQGLAGRPDGKRPLARPRRKRDDNIEKGVQEVGWGVTGGIDLAQNSNRGRTFVNAVISLAVP
jgi:hypothetical protein